MRLIRSIAALAVASAAIGCMHNASHATFSGIRNPVLLSRQDRVHARGDAAPMVKVTTFEAEAYHLKVDTQYQVGYAKTTEAALPHAAYRVTAGDPALDIRLTKVKAVAYGAMLGMRIKSYVAVEGEVFRPSAETKP
jgi:hypothetical protein